MLDGYRSALRIGFVVSFILGSSVMAGRARAATIAVSGSCSLKNAIITANKNLNTGGCTASGTFDATAFSSGNHASAICPGGGDVITVPSGTFSTASTDVIEVYSCIEIRGAGIMSSVISLVNDTDPSSSHGLTPGSDCYGNHAGIYLSATTGERANPPYLGITTLTLKEGASSGSTSAICVGRGIADINGSRVTAFGTSGINAVSNGTDGDQVYVYAASILDRNHSPGAGGAINVEGVGGYLSVDGSSIINNLSEGQGGGISWHIVDGDPFAVGNGPPFLNNSTISGNTVIGSGGGVYLVSDNAGGYYLSPGPSGGYANARITNNYATGSGGGIFRASTASYLNHGYNSSSMVAQNTADSSWCADIGDFCPVANIHGRTYGYEDNLNLLSGGDTSQGNCSNSLFYVLGNIQATGYAAPPMNEWNNPHQNVHDFNMSPEGMNPISGPICMFDPAPETELLCGLPGASQYGPASAPVMGSSCTAANQTSGVTHTVVTGSMYSNSGGTNFQATTTGQFVTYALPTPTVPGVYNVRVGLRKGANEGQFQVAVAESLTGTYTNVGGVQDSYASANTWVLAKVGNVTMTSNSTKFIRFTITGKNSASTGRQLFLDYIVFELILPMETESMTAVAKSADAHDIVIGTSYSGGIGTNLQGTGTSSFVTYQTTAPLQPGTYDVVVGFKKGNNEGIFQLATAESLTGTYTNRGSAQDAFQSSSSWVSVDLGNVTWSTTSQKYLRFSVTGKNTGSSGYQVFPDFIRLTQQ